MGVGVQFFPDIIIGLALAFVGWVIAQRVLTPRIMFAPLVCLPRRDAADQRAVRIKFKNASWYREVHSLQIVTRLRIKGLNPSRPGVNHFMDIVPDTAHVAVVTPQGNRVIRTSGRALGEHDYLLLRRYIPTFAVDRDAITIVDLLNLPREDVALMVQIQCTDSWSGTSCVRTHLYRAQDVLDGDFAAAKTRRARALRRIYRWRERIAERTHHRRARFHKELGCVERGPSAWEHSAPVDVPALPPEIAS